MKLLNYTTSYFSAILLVLISIWAVVFYYAMFDEIYDSIDDGLDNRKRVLIEKASEDMELMRIPQLDEYLYTIVKVDFNNYRGFRDTYKDTMMYMINEEDFEPVRTLESIFRRGDEYYKIKLVTSMVEEDDQIQNLLEYTILLYAVLVVSILLLNNFFLRKVWKPFYNLIGQLKTFRLDRKGTIAYTHTNIEEFALLNKSVEGLLAKTRETYIGQKQFIENASHELQTPLAIAINKLELLFEETELSPRQAEQLQLALENLERLTRLNRSLLLISKIGNDQFPDTEKVGFLELIHAIIHNFSEMAAHKNMEIQFESTTEVFQEINPDLAHFLFSNLIKNAIVHGEAGSSIYATLTNRQFSISNLSQVSEMEGEQIFRRFQRQSGSNTSNGLGLSIAHSIAERYGYAIAYSYLEGRHFFTLNFA